MFSAKSEWRSFRRSVNSLMPKVASTLRSVMDCCSRWSRRAAACNCARRYRNRGFVGCEPGPGDFKSVLAGIIEVSFAPEGLVDGGFNVRSIREMSGQIRQGAGDES